MVDGHEVPAQNKRNAIRTMIEQLVERRVAPAAIRALPPDRRLRIVPGRLRDRGELGKALAVAGVDLDRYFCDDPIVDEEAGETYVVNSQWGRRATDPTLAKLAQAFPKQR